MFPTFHHSKEFDFLSPELIRAVSLGDVQKLKSLRALSVSFSCSDRQNGDTLLHLAVRYANEQVFDYLMSLEDVPKDVVNKSGNTPLSECEGKNYFALKLLNFGCDARKASNLLLHLDRTEDGLKIGRLLLENGADANYCDEDGYTPLNNACRYGNKELIYMLLFYGADPAFALADEKFNCTDRLILCHPNLEDVLYCLLPYTDSLHLSSVEKAMTDPVKMFPEIIDRISYIRYDSDSCKSFLDNFNYFSSECFKLFIEKFEDFFSELLNSCDDDYTLTSLFRPKYLCFSLSLEKLSLPTIFEYEQILSVIVDSVNKRNMDILSFIFDDSDPPEFLINLTTCSCYEPDHSNHLGYLTETFCFLASHGVYVSTRVIEEIFGRYGYCDLFKFMLHWDLKEDLDMVFDYDLFDENIDYDFGNETTDNNIMARMIYDMNMNVDYILNKYTDCNYLLYNREELRTVFNYFALPQLNLEDQEKRTRPLPTLVELSRNAARKHIIDRFQAKNSMQFYTILKHLPIANFYKKIISFERKLYV